MPVAALDYAHFPYSDGAEHGAAVRALASNFVNPGDPMLALPSGGSPRYVPSTVVMAGVVRLCGLDVLRAIKVFVVACFLFFIAAVMLFAREYLGGQPEALWCLLSVLFLWGMGWTGANAYMFSAILYTAYFPSVVAVSLSLLALYFQLLFLRGGRNGLYVVSAVTGALAFVNHPPTGVFFLTCYFFLTVEKIGIGKRALILWVGAVSIAGALTFCWPYYDFLSAFCKVTSGAMAGTDDYMTTWHYLHSKPLLRMGPALSALPLLAVLVYRREHFFLTACFAAFTFTYVSGYFLHVSLSERFVLFATFIMQVTFGRFWADWHRSQNRFCKTVSRLMFVVVACGMCVQAFFMYSEFLKPSFGFRKGSVLPHYVNPNRVQRELKNYFHEGDVVFADVYTSWCVPVYTGAKITSLMHTAPHVTDNVKRVADSRKFFDISSSNQERWDIIKRYGATHIYINYEVGGREIVPLLQQMDLLPVVSNDDYAIFLVEKDRLQSGLDGLGKGPASF